MTNDLFFVGAVSGGCQADFIYRLEYGHYQTKCKSTETFKIDRLNCFKYNNWCDLAA